MKDVNHKTINKLMKQGEENMKSTQGSDWPCI